MSIYIYIYILLYINCNLHCMHLGIASYPSSLHANTDCITQSKLHTWVANKSFNTTNLAPVTSPQFSLSCLQVGEYTVKAIS